MICKIYIGCNLWFNKFTPLEDEIYPWLRTTGLGKYFCFAVSTVTFTLSSYF